MATKRGKNKKLPQRRKRQSTSAAPLVNVRKAFECALEAFQDKNLDEAISYLELIEAQGFMPTEVLKLYVLALKGKGDSDNLARIATELVDRCPNDPDAQFFAGMSSIDANMPVSAYLHLERLQKLDPIRAEASNITKMISSLSEQLPGILDAYPCDLPNDLPRISTIEKIEHLFMLGRFSDVCKRAEEHLRSYPRDVEIRNILTEGLALQGEGKKAFKTVSETLEINPRDLFARAVRCRLAYFSGQTEISLSDSATMMTLEPKLVSELTKAAESFAYIGNEAGIRWAYREAVERNWMDGNEFHVGRLENYFGTALAMAGDIATAIEHWKKAQTLSGDETTAKQNLDDLKLPIAEQHGPAYFNFLDWLPKPRMDELLEVLSRAYVIDESSGYQEVDATPGYMSQSVRSFAAKYPETEHLVPPMLFRGDPACQEMALMLFRGRRNQKLSEAVLEYACGKRGSDQARFQALSVLRECGYPFKSPINIQVAGTLHSIEIFNFKITDEPTLPAGRNRKIFDLLEEAYEALRVRNAEKAESIYREVRTVEPNEPDVLNNLAMALAMQNRKAEAEEVLAENAEKNPDYFFGKIADAQRKIDDKKVDEALEILKDLQRRDILHGTEFRALAKLMIYIFLEKGEKASSRYWLMMLKDYDPRCPEYAYFERRENLKSEASGIMKRLLGR